MRVKILNKDGIRENVPIYLEIFGSKKKPKVYVKNLGQVESKKVRDGHLAEFWASEKGKYQIIVDDGHSTWNGHVVVEEQRYLNFRSEFTFFSGFLLMALLGVFLWMRKKPKI